MSDSPQAPFPADTDWPELCQAAPTWALFLASVAGLMLQVMLIRWIGTEVRVFAYSQNTILVVCFLGLGLGCFHARQPIRLRWTFGSLALLFGLIALPPTRHFLQEIAEWVAPVAQTIAWVSSSGSNLPRELLLLLLGLACIFGVMLLMCLAFIPLGQIIGRLMSRHPRIVTAYSVNILGSLLGVWLFALLSRFYMPPVVWVSVSVALLFPFLLPLRAGRWREAALLAGWIPLAALAAYEPLYATVWWSPYQKLALQRIERRIAPGPDVNPAPFETVQWIKVNNVGYQAMVDRRPEFTARRPDAFPPAQQGLTQYDIPFRLRPNSQRVLLAGAGSGNDAAGALRAGVAAITAVDIDPAIIALGRLYHPEQPYGDASRVRVVVDDARSFFAACGERFDLIVFGLLDAHTTASLANARLDHYVYTRESIQQVHRLMTPDGLLVVTFNQQHPYIIDRLARTLRDEFGAAPLVFDVPENAYGFGGVMLVAGNVEAVRRQIALDPPLAALLRQWAQERGGWEERLTFAIEPATDDWPYLYLPSRTIPVLFLVVAALVYLLLGTVKRLLGFRHLVAAWNRTHWHFALLGAAFLFLEVQNISRASVVLGNTWLVSAVIISGVLCMILLANLIAVLWPRLPRRPVYAFLLTACIALYFIDLTAFAHFPTGLKIVLVGGITTLPMLGSGLVFINSFRAVADKSEALGANLIGSLLGGLLEAITYVTGTKALLLLVTLLYAAAIATAPRAEQPRTAAEPHPSG